MDARKANRQKAQTTEMLAAMVRDTPASQMPAPLSEPSLPDLMPGQRYEAKFHTPTEQERAIGRMATKPSNNAAVVIEKFVKRDFGEQSPGALAEALSESAKKVIGGNMDQVEEMLISQAHSLQSIFVNMAGRASKAEHFENLERFMRMAMKAQNQCRMTLETLATIKNPPVVYAKQANIANGPQQVNNGIPVPARTGGSTIQSNELLDGEHG